MEKSKVKIEFTLSFSGQTADDHMIDFEDMLVALGGFHRTLSLTTHLILNGELITDASLLKGAQIYAIPPEKGSWKIKAIVAVTSLVGGLSALGTVSRDTVTGHLVYSAYDYAIKKSLGFHVDYDQSLYQQYLKNQNIIPSQDNERLLNDLAIECKSSIVDIHCPIYRKKSASSAAVTVKLERESTPVGKEMNLETYQFIAPIKKIPRSEDRHENLLLQSSGPCIEVRLEHNTRNINGRISRFNINTFKGRMLDIESKKSMNFELSPKCRGDDDVDLIIKSLSVNATRQVDKQQGIISCTIQPNIENGRVRNYTITSINRE